MSAKGVCRIGDHITGTCQAAVSGHPRTFTGTWTTGSGLVFADGLGVVRVGDHGITDCGHHIVAATGSTISQSESLALMRVGDTVTIVEGGFGVTTSGSNVVDSL